MKSDKTQIFTRCLALLITALKVGFLFAPLLGLFCYERFNGCYSLFESNKYTLMALLIVVSLILLKYYLNNLQWLLQVNQKIIYWKRSNHVNKELNDQFSTLKHSEMPIYTENSDMIDIREYVKDYYNNYIQQSFNCMQNFVILLDGEFGVGKSSFINLIIEHINKSLSEYNFLRCENINVVKISALKFISFAERDSDENKLIEFAHHIRSHLLSSERKFFNVFFDSLKETNLKFGILDFKFAGLITKEQSLDKFSSNKYLIVIEDLDRLELIDLKVLIKILFLIHDIPNAVTILPLSSELLKTAIGKESAILKMINRTIELPRLMMNHNLAKNMIEEHFGEYLRLQCSKYQCIDAYNLTTSFFISILSDIFNKNNISYRDIKQLNFVESGNVNFYPNSLRITDIIIQKIKEQFTGKYHAIEDDKLDNHLALIIKDVKYLGYTILGANYKHLVKGMFKKDTLSLMLSPKTEYLCYYFVCMLYLNENIHPNKIFGNKEEQNIFNWINEPNVNFKWFNDINLVKLSILFLPSILNYGEQGNNFRIIQSLYLIFILAFAKCFEKYRELISIMYDGKLLLYNEPPMEDIYLHSGKKINFKDYPIYLNLDHTELIPINKSVDQIKNIAFIGLNKDKDKLSIVEKRVREILQTDQSDLIISLEKEGLLSKDIITYNILP